MKLIYNLGILVYTAIAGVVSLFNHKARLLVNGRKNWYEMLKQKIDPGSDYIWIHCASLGEFEQGRPVIETIKKEKPDLKIVLSFFSPSGFEIRKNYPLADIICYLPSDTPGNAKKFIDLIDPVFVIFVKYEFWYNFLSTLKRKGTPLYLISAIFREDQPFFRWYGTFFLNMLRMFKMIYVQDDQSLELLKMAGMENVVVAGDTRFDRVAQIAASAREIKQLDSFRGNEKLFIAGSSWKPDEEIIARYINSYPGRMKWVFAPHETDKSNIDRLGRLFKVDVVRYSEFSEEKKGARVLIIDNIGMLSSAYRYAYLVAIGGGFGKGIHNILEAACWNIPVFFGPEHQKFREAVDLIAIGGARCYTSYDEFEKILNNWIDDEIKYKEAAEKAGNYVRKNSGATEKILKGIL